MLVAGMAILVLVVQLLVQPYQKRYVNIIESLILMNLVVVCMLYLNPFRSETYFVFSTILLLAPFIYGLLYMTWSVFNKCFL